MPLVVLFAGSVLAGQWALRGSGAGAEPPPGGAVDPWMREPDPLLIDIDRAEEVAAAVQSALRKTVLRGIQRRDRSLLLSGLAEGFEGRFPTPDHGEPVEEEGLRARFFAQGALPVLGREAFVDASESFSAPLTAFERASWRTFQNRVSTGEPRFVRQAVHLKSGGVRGDGARVELSAILEIEAVPGGPEGWQLRRADVQDAVLLEVARPPFADVGQGVGFTLPTSKEEQQIVQEVIDQRAIVTMGGVTALDYDRDGAMDLLVTLAGRKTLLYRNDGKGGFRVERLPLLDEPAESAKFYLWLDLDNDGKEELVGTQVLEQEGGKARLGLYTWRSGRMEEVRDALRFEVPRWMRSLSYEGITACDVNDDQLIDLVVIGYSHLNFTPEDNYVDAQDGLRNLLFINQGGLRFSEEGLARGLVDERYSFIAACHDLDRDGDLDLFVGNDYGRNNVYLNDGTGHFRHESAHPFHLGPSFSMGLAVADYDNTGEYAFYVSNMYSHAGNRIVPLAASLSAEMRAAVLGMAGGNTLYEREGDGWVERAADKGVEMADWAWGSTFFDLDNDTDKDLYVVNGYTTHSDPHLPDD